MISEDDTFEYYRGYKVPKHYSIPPDYATPEEIASEQRTTTKQTIQQSQKEWVDAKTAALITAGMVGLLGGVAIGRISKRKKVE